MSDFQGFVWRRTEIHQDGGDFVPAMAGAIGEGQVWLGIPCRLEIWPLTVSCNDVQARVFLGQAAQTFAQLHKSFTCTTNCDDTGKPSCSLCEECCTP